MKMRIGGIVASWVPCLAILVGCGSGSGSVDTLLPDPAVEVAGDTGQSEVQYDTTQDLLKPDTPVEIVQDTGHEVVSDVLSGEVTQVTGTLGGTIEGDAWVPEGEVVEVTSDVVTVQGNLTVMGSLFRNTAGFTLVVEGDFHMGPLGVVISDLPDDNPDDEDLPASDGLILIVMGNVQMDEGSTIETNGIFVLSDDLDFVPSADGSLAGDAVGLLTGSFDYPEIDRLDPPINVMKVTAFNPLAPQVQSIRPVAGLDGDIVTFEAELDPAYPDADSWSWDFGNGASPSTSSDEFPVVTLGSPGAHVGTLVLTSGGQNSTTRFVYLVFAQNSPPMWALWNLCGNVNLNPPHGANPAAWIFGKAVKWAGCAKKAGGGGGGGGPKPKVNWVFKDPKPRKAKVGKCGTVKGRKGRNGFSGFIWVVGNLSVEADWDITLADGGLGGDAQAVCDVPGADATAIGGAGGRPGRLSFKAGFNLGIPMAIDFSKGSLDITPGFGGDGGHAMASTVNGNDGCPGQDAGTATAVGGEGHPTFFGTFAGGGVVGGPPGSFGSKAAGIIFWSLGAKKGMDNVSIDGNLIGGDGGNATAKAGNGGNGTPCACAGGAGGGANATGGDGGMAEYKAFTAAASAINRFWVVDDTGGDGGNSNAQAGNGGAGGDCPKCAVVQGGPGGAGGDASSDSGKGGESETDGTDGTPTGTPGNGGPGGDGCPPGIGGAPGTLTTLTGHENPQSSQGIPGAFGADTCCCVPISICDDQDPCTDDHCDPATEDCSYTPKDCDDDNPCTEDSCHPETGKCVNECLARVYRLPRQTRAEFA